MAENLFGQKCAISIVMAGLMFILMKWLNILVSLTVERLLDFYTTVQYTKNVFVMEYTDFMQKNDLLEDFLYD